MRFISRVLTRRSIQRRRGQSLVEALVASALLGVAVIVGITALDTATLGARQAVHEAWAQCMVRGELEAIMDAAWSDVGYPAPANVTVQITWSAASSVPAQKLQKVTVQALDPDSNRVLFTQSAYKASILAGGHTLAPSQIAVWCNGLFGSP
jgi:Tfp pilus assembly protein PilV